MTKREIEIKVRLNEKEAEHLNRQVEKCRLPREAYLRHLIAGVVPREAPPPEYFAFMRELHYVGNLLNQIAQKAHVLNVIDVKRYDVGSLYPGGHGGSHPSGKTGVALWQQLPFGP